MNCISYGVTKGSSGVTDRVTPMSAEFVVLNFITSKFTTVQHKSSSVCWACQLVGAQENNVISIQQNTAM